MFASTQSIDSTAIASTRKSAFLTASLCSFSLSLSLSLSLLYIDLALQVRGIPALELQKQTDKQNEERRTEAKHKTEEFVFACFFFYMRRVSTSDERRRGMDFCL